MHFNAPRPKSDSESLAREEQVENEDEIGDADRGETSGDIISVPEIDEQQRIDQVSNHHRLIKILNESFLRRAQISVMKSKVTMKEAF